MEEEKQEPLNEYFLKAILTEKQVPMADTSLTKRLKEMLAYAEPDLTMDENNEYSISYVVNYKDVKDKIMTEEEAYNLRTHGWKLSDDEQNIVLQLK